MSASGCRSGRKTDMSALGQKQTYAAQKAMSALPPIATAKPKFRKRACPLYPRKRTYAVQLGMSALGHKQTWVSVHSDTAAKGEVRPALVQATFAAQCERDLCHRRQPSR